MTSAVEAGRRDRVAAIDCGTNSIRLLIAEQDQDGHLVDLDRRVEIVRLGQGVDATGEFHPDALARTFAAVDQYAAVIQTHDIAPNRIHVVATSAARDVPNRGDFFAGIRERLGVEPDVVSGATEAKLSFNGVLSRMSAGRIAEGQTTVTAGSVLVMDIGGGSTELIVGSAAGEIRTATSLDIGSVRLTERFLPTSPPSVADLDRATAFVDEVLTGSTVDLGAVRSWIGVAGTVTTIAAVALGLQTYDRQRVHGAVLSRGQILALLASLSSSSVAQIRAIATMHPQRADVITAGTLIAARVALRVGTDALMVSESDILDGIALDLLDSPSGDGPVDEHAVPG